MKNVLKYQLPPLLWIALIYVLSSIPKFQESLHVPLGFDKIIHAVMFFVLCLLVRRAFIHQEYFLLLRDHALLGAAIFSIVYGILDEYHQQFTPGRIPDLYDVLADAGGTLLYVGVFLLARTAKVKKESSQAG